MYEAPSIQDLGSVEELTNDLNKVGHKHDMYSHVTPLVGSIITA